MRRADLSEWIFPWGKDYISQYLVQTGNAEGHLWDVGSKPDGDSWVGAQDMAGNAYEWTSSIAIPYDPQNGYVATHEREDLTDLTSARVIRGGSFLHKELESASSAHRFSGPPA